MAACDPPPASLRRRVIATAPYARDNCSVANHAAPLEPLGGAPEAGSNNAVEAYGLTFSYGGRHALNEVTFTIARGEIFGFLGPNGGGKTTLFRLLSTLVAPERGSLRIMGCDSGAQTQRLRMRIGVVFQHPSVDERLTVIENLLHHGHLYGLRGKTLIQRAGGLLERVSLADRSRDLVGTLSGGQKRRVELAKALLHEPSLLILDEPSTGLDPAARREFNDHLARLRERGGLTVAMTTHYMEEAERCDRIGILCDGELAAMAPPGRLKERIGGDVIVIRPTSTANGLVAELSQRLGVNAKLVGGTIRIERPRGHELVHRIVESFGDKIESVNFGKPTLEDVFIHLTGRQFFANESESRA